jgi:hypothetical protein
MISVRALKTGIALTCLVLVLFVGALTSYILDSDVGPPIFASFFALVAGILSTYFSYRNGTIDNFGGWALGFTVYVALSYLVFIFLWFAPLTELGALRTPSQMPEYQDANFYDYIATVAAEAPLAEWADIVNSTWLSQGVISYLASIYSLFGVSAFNFFLINLILGYGSALFLQGLIGAESRLAGLAAIFSPFVLYYLCTPGKEVLTNFMVLLILLHFYSTLFLKNNFSYLRILKLIAFLLVLAIIRVNAALMVIAVLGLYLFFNSTNKIRLLLGASAFLSVFFGALYFSGFYEVVLALLEFNTYFDAFNLRLENVEAGSVKYLLGTALTNENPFIHAALFPFRTVVWLVAPLPAVNIYDLFRDVLFGSAYSRFRAGEALMRVASSLGMLSFIIFAVREFLRHGKAVFCQRRGFILFCAIGFAVILSSTQFIEGARYRTVVEPLAFCWLVSIIFSSGRPRRSLDRRRGG